MQTVPLRIGIAGSTAHTLVCAQALQVDPRFSIKVVLTPEPKPIGRKQLVTANPLHQWADASAIPAVLIGKRLDDAARAALQDAANEIDILLVVDFGYLVPKWLLEFPKIAALNIHPSLLPRWRGSSPGQFVLLYGDQTSAVTLMRMTAGLDEGPVIAQPKLRVNDHWTQHEYYDQAFALITQSLGDEIVAYAASVTAGSPAEHAQPTTSPTPTARRLTKEDGFVAWTLLSDLMLGKLDRSRQWLAELSPLLQDANANGETAPRELATLVERASRALAPWPGLWTLIPTTKGEKRMKILQCTVRESRLVLQQVHIEGQQPARFESVKNSIA